MVHRVTQLIAAPHPRLSTSPVLLASPHSILPQGHIRYRACHFVRVCLFHRQSLHPLVQRFKFILHVE